MTTKTIPAGRRLTADELAAIDEWIARNVYEDEGGWLYCRTDADAAAARLVDLREHIRAEARLIEAGEELADTGNHRPDCPQAEWSGVEPTCDCGWRDALNEWEAVVP